MSAHTCSYYLHNGESWRRCGRPAMVFAVREFFNDTPDLMARCADHQLSVGNTTAFPSYDEAMLHITKAQL